MHENTTTTVIEKCMDAWHHTLQSLIVKCTEKLQHLLNVILMTYSSYELFSCVSQHTAVICFDNK